MDSTSYEQSTHGPLFYRLWRWSRWEVQHLSISASQEKNLHVGGVRVLQSSFAPEIPCCPMKKA
jgi:hypothetical protein